LLAQKCETQEVLDLLTQAHAKSESSCDTICVLTLYTKKVLNTVMHEKKRKRKEKNVLIWLVEH